MGAVSRALRRPETYAGLLREIGGLAQCAARYPLGIAAAGVGAFARTGDDRHDTPVVLVHGYGHNRSGWFALQRHLRRAGFPNVVTVNYNPLTADVPGAADRLAAVVEDVLRRSGAARVHVVGHSLGGIVLRWYVQERGGDRTVHTAVTIASPHEGTVLARACLGRTARQLTPGSPLLRTLTQGARPTPVRWIAYYSNIDALVHPARSAMLRHPALGAENVLVKDHGHLSVLLSSSVARSIVTTLEAAEHAPAAGATG